MNVEVRTTPAPIETVTPIRPSEAIRLGMLKYPVQAQGDTIKGNTACAVGATLGGFGWDELGDDSTWADYRLHDVIPRDVGGCPADPACHWNEKQRDPDEIHLGGAWALAHLNDGPHDWTREQIADWLESLGS